VLSPEADVFYQVTAEYSYEHDRGIRWNDPTFHVAWPVAEPKLSAKDLKQPFLAESRYHVCLFPRPDGRA
jgi:dTDP-4-dehydrorhamnose 3,5-epimerase